MIFFQTDDDGVQELIVARMLAFVIRTPRVVKSVGEVERKIVNPVNVPPGVQVNEG
jgi:hypothetical protein